MVVFTVFIDGGLEDVHTFEVEEGTKGIITVILPYSTAVSIDDSFEIKTDGTTWIKGKVQRIKIQRKGMTDTKVLTCYGKTHTLYEKFCLDFGFHQYFNRDVGWIVNDLVDHYFGGILTSVNVNVATGVNVTSFECDGRSVGEALEDLASRGDCNFYVDNDDDVHFFVRPGAASGLTAENLGEIKIIDESGRKFVKVIVRGRHRAIQASAGAGYPEFFYQDDRIISIAEAGEVATAMVAELGATRQQVVAREDSFMETRAGKTIILNVPADGFNNQVIEIQKIRWVCKQPNLNRTYFTVGDKEPTIDSVLAKMARGVEWLPDVQISRGAAFPTDPADEMAFSLTGDVAVPANYSGAAEGILYTWDAVASVWKRPPRYLGRRAADPAAGSGVTGDTYFNTGDNITYQWDGAAWSQTSSLNIADNPDFPTVEWPTDQLAIEVRPWTGNFSLVWDDRDDDPPTDWNHFKWGLRDQENIADATIHYSSGVPATVDVNFGQDINVADGEWFVYWDETQITGGNYDVQWTQVYSNASGIGKGLIAVVQVRNATSESPSVLPWNAYIPQLGVGAFVSHSIYSKHIAVDWLTAKNLRSAVGVGELGGPAGVLISGGQLPLLAPIPAGIYGYSGGTTKSFYLLASDGKAYAGAGAVILDTDGITVKGEKIEFQDAGGVRRGTIYGVNTGAFTIFSEDFILLAPGANGTKVNAGPVFPGADGTQDLGKPGARWDDVYAVDLWGRFHWTDMYMADIVCPKCNQLFEKRDELAFIVKNLKDYEDSDLKEIVCVPIHKRCNQIKLLRRWLECRLFGFKE